MSYSFTKNVNKIPAFQAYLQQNFSLFTGFNSDGNQFTIYTSETLSSQDEALLNQLIADYVDPEYFLTLENTQSLSGLSKRCIGTSTPLIVQSLIFPKRIENGLVLDSLKTVVSFLVEDITTLIGSTSGIVTWSIFDYTRNFEIGTQEFDFSDKVIEWATAASNGQTGSVDFYRCMMFDGLITKTTNYDCIWQFKLSVSNPNVTVQMNGLQMLYYNVI